MTTMQIMAQGNGAVAVGVVAGAADAGVAGPGREGEKEQHGFSLVEVIIAMGMLAGVLISIAGMYILGGRQVKAGKTMTVATSMCHDIMESFDNQSFVSLYTNLGATTSDTTKTRLSTDSTSPIYPWNTEIRQKLQNGAASVTIVPLGSGTPNFGSATAIRMTVTLTWNELGRPQTVSLSTVRL